MALVRPSRRRRTRHLATPLLGHAVRDDKDYATHMDYVHFNPVKHGLVASPAAWPYSTFKSCARRGLYPLDWMGSGIQDVPAGEPGE